MNEQKTTVYIVSWNGRDTGGGVERVVGIIKRIIEKQYPVIIIDKGFVEKDRLLKKLCVINNPVIPMIAASLCARKVVCKRDILIGNGFNAPFVKKDITIAHGCMYTYKIATGEFAWSGSTFFEKISMRNSRRVLPVSKEAQNAIIKYYKVKGERTRIINNCVNTDLFFPIESEEKGSTLTVLFCGRLEKAKGLDILLQIAELISDSPNMKLSIATPNIENKNLFSHMQNVEVHVGVGLDKINQFYNSGHVFLFPSKFEGFEMVTLEALSAGIPVVGNRVGAIRELLGKGFEGVYEVRKGAPAEVLQQLIEVANEYRFSISKRMKLHGRVREYFGLEKYADKIVEEVERSLSTKEQI